MTTMAMAMPNYILRCIIIWLYIVLNRNECNRHKKKKQKKTSLHSTNRFARPFIWWYPKTKKIVWTPLWIPSPQTKNEKKKNATTKCMNLNSKTFCEKQWCAFTQTTPTIHIESTKQIDKVFETNKKKYEKICKFVEKIFKRDTQKKHVHTVYHRICSITHQSDFGFISHPLIYVKKKMYRTE